MSAKSDLFYLKDSVVTTVIIGSKWARIVEQCFAVDVAGALAVNPVDYPVHSEHQEIGASCAPAKNTRATRRSKRRGSKRAQAKRPRVRALLSDEQW